MIILFLFFILLLPAANLKAQPVLTNSIIVGGVTSYSARFWIKTSEPASINIQASVSPEFSDPVSGISVVTSTESNNAAIITISGLQPSTKYFYRPLVNDAVADNSTRSFKTFPAEGSSANFVFTFGSCQQNGDSLSSRTPPGNVFREIIKHSPDFFLQIGDWGYPDTTDNLPYDNNIFSSNWESVQNSYVNKYDSSYPMDSLLRTIPIDYVYDDHDYLNNNASALSSSFFVPFRPNPLGDDFVVDDIAAPAEARTNSIRGYLENFPGYELSNSSRGIYHKFTYGNADFFVLDLRSQRSPNLTGFSKNMSSGWWSFTPPEGHSILGRDNAPGSGESQYNWFLNGLLNSTADWKFIISSVPLNKAQKQALDLGIALQTATINYPDSSLPPGTSPIIASMELADKWIAFPEDLNGVLDFINQNNIKNVIVLSGDSHTSALDDGTNAGLPELMSGNLDITNSQIVSVFEMFGLHIWNRGGQGISTDEFNNAFGKVTVSGKDSVRLSLIDEYGTEFASHTIVNNITSVSADKNFIEDYTLEQNYPNPFNPITFIEFQISDLPAGRQVSEPGHVEIKVYDVIGREVAVLVNEEKPSGYYQVSFDGSSLASGIYYYQMKVNGYVFTRKMILMR